MKEGKTMGRYRFQGEKDVPFTDRNGRPYDAAAERKDAEAAHADLSARAAANAPKPTPPRFVGGQDASWGDELTPQQVLERAQEIGARAQRELDDAEERRSAGRRVRR
jgi:hypothetical protein